MERAAAAFGRLDVVVNNAARCSTGWWRKPRKSRSGRIWM
ncbi:hypothetical protein ACFQX6_13960 [Streptosporangium lutulentum]